MRALSPDWAGRTVASLVGSAPVGALYTALDEVLVGWAAAKESRSGQCSSMSPRNTGRSSWRCDSFAHC